MTGKIVAATVDINGLKSMILDNYHLESIPQFKMLTHLVIEALVVDSDGHVACGDHDFRVYLPLIESIKKSNNGLKLVWAFTCKYTSERSLMKLMETELFWSSMDSLQFLNVSVDFVCLDMSRFKSIPESLSLFILRYIHRAKLWVRLSQHLDKKSFTSVSDICGKTILHWGVEEEEPFSSYDLSGMDARIIIWLETFGYNRKSLLRLPRKSVITNRAEGGDSFENVWDNERDMIYKCFHCNNYAGVLIDSLSDDFEPYNENSVLYCVDQFFF